MVLAWLVTVPLAAVLGLLASGLSGWSMWDKLKPPGILGVRTERIAISG